MRERRKFRREVEIVNQGLAEGSATGRSGRSRVEQSEGEEKRAKGA